MGADVEELVAGAYEPDLLEADLRPGRSVTSIRPQERGRSEARWTL